MTSCTDISVNQVQFSLALTSQKDFVGSFFTISKHIQSNTEIGAFGRDMAPRVHFMESPQCLQRLFHNERILLS